MEPGRAQVGVLDGGVAVDVAPAGCSSAKMGLGLSPPATTTKIACAEQRLAEGQQAASVKVLACLLNAYTGKRCNNRMTGNAGDLAPPTQLLKRTRVCQARHTPDLLIFRPLTRVTQKRALRC